jgi:hypothetical protein
MGLLKIDESNDEYAVVPFPCGFNTPGYVCLRKVAPSQQTEELGKFIKSWRMAMTPKEEATLLFNTFALKSEVKKD